MTTSKFIKAMKRAMSKVPTPVGPFSLGIGMENDQLVYILQVPGEPVGYPAVVDVDGVDVPLIVRGGFEPPRPL